MCRPLTILFLFLSCLFSKSAIAQDSSMFPPGGVPGEGVLTKEATNKEAVKVLSEYLQIPSLSGSEEEAALFLSDYCREKGLYITSLPSDNGSPNFAATLYPLSVDKPVIWLQHHMDVVPANTLENWRYEPFSGTVARDTIWGRGALDNKGQGSSAY